jgi:putative transposase
MPRRQLKDAGGLVLHVLNRSAKRTQLFFNDEDYSAFEEILGRALARTPTRLLCYCLMPNHWHLVMWPIGNELPAFMHWLGTTHAKHWHETHGTNGTGHVYQSRYRAIPVQTETHLISLLRYVERNPLRASLVDRAEQWRWSSLWRRCQLREDTLLSEWPVAAPANWIEIVNSPQTVAEIEAIQKAVRSNRPLGNADWEPATVSRLQMAARPPGRPRKSRRASFFEK